VPVCQIGIREFWNPYSTSDLTEDEKVTYDRRFKSNIQKAIDAKVGFLGDTGLVLTGYRSAAPTSVQSINDLPELYEYYWDHGSTDGDPSSLSEAKHPNPMFAPLETDIFTLHYSTDPLLGFHLATAYAPLTPESPFHLKSPGHSHLHKVVEAARLQFRAWSTSFRRCARHDLTLRFFAGDALAFCHTLQHKIITRDDISVHWYRGPYQLEPLVLDSEDYASSGKAPLSFNVISREGVGSAGLHEKRNLCLGLWHLRDYSVEGAAPRDDRRADRKEICQRRVPRYRRVASGGYHSRMLEREIRGGGGCGDRFKGEAYGSWARAHQCR
jgi:hypothetical protein